MILMVWGGFAITSVNAQSCQPCPPACCKVATCEPGKSSAGVNQSPVAQNALVAFSPEAMAECGKSAKVSNKDTKNCQVACAPACGPGSAASSQATPKPVAVHQVSAPASKPVKQ